MPDKIIKLFGAVEIVVLNAHTMGRAFTCPERVLPPASESLRFLVELEFTESSLVFYLNGKKIVVKNPNPEWTLLDFIRSQHGLKGTKLGCGEGGCGACVRFSLYTIRSRHNCTSE